MMKLPCRYVIGKTTDGNLSVSHKFIGCDYRLHWHDCCEAEIVLSGSGMQELNGNRYRLEMGSLTMLTPADCHSVKIDEPMELITVMFTPEVISKDVYTALLTREMLGRNLYTHLVGEHFFALRGLFEALCFDAGRLPDADDGTGECFSGHILDGILTDLLRCCPAERSVSVKGPIGEAVLYLHGHFHERVMLADMAGLTHLSENYFSELFRTQTGHTFKGYLIDLRMHNACRLLANTDMTVTDVCYACGFESFSNFMRTFKERFGMSPLKFRAQNRSAGGTSEKTQ